MASRNKHKHAVLLSFDSDDFSSDLNDCQDGDDDNGYPMYTVRPWVLTASCSFCDGRFDAYTNPPVVKWTAHSAESVLYCHPCLKASLERHHSTPKPTRERRSSAQNQGHAAAQQARVFS